ncbi:MAG: bifunctional aminoglycoside phosphotransferase/ATP-binding protein [Syntrophales bacterium]
MTHPNLLHAMFRPEFYPHRPEHIELIQTHISYVFLAGDYVYKVKKSVNFDFLDFTTIERRRFYCNEELRLNRRLAPQIYLDVLEIGEDAEGNIVLGKGERVIDYAVLMKKLPQDRMLQKVLQRGEADLPIMNAVARKLSDFHTHAATGGNIDEIGGVETIHRNHDENFEETRDYINITIPEHQYRFIKYYAYDFMDRHQALLVKRVQDHKIRDCHGDLHLEHICIMDSGTRLEGEGVPENYYMPDDIVIFDCIEFNERFRYEDVASEVAFLSMDLDYNGYPDYADAFVSAYMRHADDREIGRLQNFYKCYYAYVRGKVTSFRLGDSSASQDLREEEIITASRYFDLAYTYSARLEKPTLIIMAGLTGTGKSVRANSIAPRIGAEVIRTDILRKEMLHMQPSERHTEAFGTGIYRDEVTRKTYDRAIELASEKLTEGKSVIIDASYKSSADRQEALATAERLKADFFIIECICPENIVKERLDLRMSDKRESSDGRWEIYLAQKETFERITEMPENSHIIIDTSLTPEECTYKALQKIKNFPLEP